MSVKRTFSAALIGLVLTQGIANGEDSLKKWVTTYDTADTQYKILSRIFSALGSKSAAKRDPVSEMFIFPTNGAWIRLSKDLAWSGNYETGQEAANPYLGVSCMLSHEPTGSPINATTYLLRNTTDRPTALSGGYASHEKIEKITLPKLKKSFLLVSSYSGEWGAGAQWTAVLLEVSTDRNPRTVWMSPASVRNFQFGFDALGGPSEKLILKAQRGNSQYSAYRWSGARFEPDALTFESRLREVPDSVFQHGTGTGQAANKKTEY